MMSNKKSSKSNGDCYFNDPHPYGVLPSGNAYFCSAEHSLVRPKGLGPLMCIIGDEALVEILGYLNASDLSHTSICSRALYVYSHHSDLWRDVTLRRWENQPIQYVRSWKETYMKSVQCDYIAASSSSGVSGSASHSTSTKECEEKWARHEELSVRGIFSNLLHRSWTCHTCDLATACPGFFKHNDVERRKGSELSVSEFREQYERPNNPLIITGGAVDYWPAMTTWGSDFLRDCGKEIASKSATGKEPTFRATSATAPVAATFTLEGYFNYMRQAREEAPLYLFDRDFITKIQRLAKDYDVPKYFRSTSDGSCLGGEGKEEDNDKNEQGEDGVAAIANACTASESKGLSDMDLFRVFGSEVRPDHKWLICGPKRSGSIFHIDPNKTNAWNVSVQGRKKWIFYPPDVHPPGVLSSTDGADVTVPISTGEWLLSFWKDHLEARKHPDVSQRPMEAIVGAGDIVFVPHGYWHMVVNIDDCIALTHNYVSSANLVNCLRFLRDTPDQISGIRDRANTVDPDTMYSSFIDRLTACQALPQNELDMAVRQSKKNVHTGVEADGLPSIIRRKRKRKAEAVAEVCNSIGSAETEGGEQGKRKTQGQGQVGAFSFRFSF